MKLKKIASLALVGVMAVSMFAGCSDAPVDDNQVITTSPVVSALNDAQDKVEFSSDSYLTNAMSQVVTKVGTDSTIDADEMAEYILAGKDLRSSETLEKHADWYDTFKDAYTFTPENVEGILQDEIGKVFVKVLEDAGVYKCTEEGLKAFHRFIDVL